MVDTLHHTEVAALSVHGPQQPRAGGYPSPLLVVIILGAFLLLSNAALAAPAEEEVWTFLQPDGTPFKAYVIGDEFYAYYETPDGQPIIRNAQSGYWYYAMPKADGTLEQTAFAVGLSTPESSVLNVERGLWEQAVADLAADRAQAAAEVRAPSENATTSGLVKGVLLLANFSDTTTQFAPADFTNLMNTVGYNSNGALGSVRDFYNENSYGAFTLQMDVYGWFTLPQTRTYYGQNSSGQDLNPRQMVIDALAASNSTVNYANYDADGDGRVDVFGVVHQGQGEESGGGPNAIWSHAWTLLLPVTVDGKDVQEYFTAPELKGTTTLATIGVYCHEMAHHMFYLPDLYDLDGSSYGVGNWSVMGYGVYLGPSGAKPCHFDPWCKIVLGWLTPTTITSSATGIALPSLDTNASALLVPVDPYADGEYFLVCNRYKRTTAEPETGFDQYLPGSGALIMHIDDYVRNNSTEALKKVDVEEADGLNHLDNKTNQGDANDLYPTGTSAFNNTSNPNTKDNGGNSTGIVVDTFTGAGTASMTCSVTPPASLSGSSIGYDQMGSDGSAFGYDGLDYAVVRFTTAGGGTLERVKTYFFFGGTTNYTVYVYSGWSGGAPSGLLTSQSGSHVGKGYEEITLTSPQSFGASTDFYVQVRYDSGYITADVLPVTQDWQCDQRSWISTDGVSYTNLTPANDLPYDINIRADLATDSTSTVDAHTTPQTDLDLPDWNDTEGEKMTVLKFKISDHGTDSMDSLVDRLTVAISGTAGEAASDIAWAELVRDGSGQLATAASITDTQLVFGSAPDDDTAADLDSITDNTSAEYSVNIYVNSALTGAHDATYVFDINETLVEVDGASSSPMSPDSGAIQPVIGTLFVTQLGVSLDTGAWMIGPLGLNDVVGWQNFTVTNESNVAADIAIGGSNGQGGWNLSATVGTDAFRVEADADGDEVADVDISVGTQNLYSSVVAAGEKTFGLRYSAPSGDTKGPGEDQSFSITVSVSAP